MSGRRPGCNRGQPVSIQRWPLWDGPVSLRTLRRGRSTAASKIRGSAAVAVRNRETGDMRAAGSELIIPPRLHLLHATAACRPHPPPPMPPPSAPACLPPSRRVHPLVLTTSWVFAPRDPVERGVVPPNWPNSSRGPIRPASGRRAQACVPTWIASSSSRAITETTAVVGTRSGINAGPSCTVQPLGRPPRRNPPRRSDEVTAARAGGSRRGRPRISR